MKAGRGIISLLGIWATGVILAGAVLTSYHQPFLEPGSGILNLVPNPGEGHWRLLHVLSGNCGCSRRVIQHLLQRGPFPGAAEQVLLVEGEEGDLAGTEDLIARLNERGFAVTRIASRNIPREVGLRGVPVLVVASPVNGIAYLGGYGNGGDQDGAVLQRVTSGGTMDPLPVLGCAVGSRIRRQADPFGLKYSSDGAAKGSE